MSFRLVIRTEAERDLAEAFKWYEQRRKNLGAEFLSEIRSSLRLVEENPFRHAIVYRAVRQALPRRFPYRVLYLVEGQSIEVIAVVHAKRHLSAWQGRV